LDRRYSATADCNLVSYISRIPDTAANHLADSIILQHTYCPTDHSNCRLHGESTVAIIVINHLDLNPKSYILHLEQQSHHYYSIGCFRHHSTHPASNTLANHYIVRHSLLPHRLIKAVDPLPQPIMRDLIA
jgi:hypothetical protein